MCYTCSGVLLVTRHVTFDPEELWVIFPIMLKDLNKINIYIRRAAARWKTCILTGLWAESNKQEGKNKGNHQQFYSPGVQLLERPSCIHSSHTSLLCLLSPHIRTGSWTSSPTGLQPQKDRRSDSSGPLCTSCDTCKYKDAVC